MALSVRRPSDWSVVLCTEAGQVIRFDRENLRLRPTQSAQRVSFSETDLQCPLCHQVLPTDLDTPRSSDPHEGPILDETDSTTVPFVHPEYFRLLASCLEEENAVEVEEEHDHLRNESFNQGYCDRFFVQEGLLGRGGKAEVFKVRHVLEGVSLGVFALKRVAVGDSQSWLLRTLQEVQSLRFKHPNLVSYNHVWLERCQRAYAPTVPVLHILQEYCDGGDLESYVLKLCGKEEPTVEQLKARTRRRSNGQSSQEPRSAGMSIEMVYSFFKDISAGLACLHERGMIHRDMKSSNCLIDTQVLPESGFPRILVSDFGEAQLMSSEDKRTGSTGTLSYTAPEIVRGEKWTAAADMFSLGMILYFLTHEGTLPYRSAEEDFDGLKEEILAFRGYPMFEQNPNLSKDDKRELETVLASLLSPDPLDRPSCTDLLARMQLHDRKSTQPLQRPHMRTRSSATLTQRSAIAPMKWPATITGAEESLLVRSPKLILHSKTKAHAPLLAELQRLGLVKANIRTARHDILSLTLFVVRSSILIGPTRERLSSSALLMMLFLLSLAEIGMAVPYTTRLTISIFLYVATRVVFSTMLQT